MFDGVVNFSTIPKVGIAHHFYTDKPYNVCYGKEKSIEIVYVKSGSITCELFDKEFTVSEGSFLIIFRHLPIKLHTDANPSYSHCCLRLLTNYDFKLFGEDTEKDIVSAGLILPFVTPPGKYTEDLRNLLFSAVSDIGISKKNELSCSLAGLSILQKLSGIYKKILRENQGVQSILEYQVKKYISTNLFSKLSLEDIAKHLNKTPNYLNYVFKKECGMSIGRYINEEKVRVLCEMIQYREIPFSIACENIGITDISYGYRLFKKHTGLTPKEYLSSNKKVT